MTALIGLIGNCFVSIKKHFLRRIQKTPEESQCFCMLPVHNLVSDGGVMTDCDGNLATNKGTLF